jgi:hypothetical protein
MVDQSIHGPPLSVDHIGSGMRSAPTYQRAFIVTSCRAAPERVLRESQCAAAVLALLVLALQ